MQTRDEALANIAATILDLETLDTRKSDRLDFHELAVWQIKKALEAAYAAGCAGTLTNGQREGK